MKPQSTQHTPGPWHVNGSEITPAIWVEESDGKRICTIKPSEQDASNARLIAAAPETAAERDRLRAVNAELVKVVQAYLSTVENKKSKPDLADVDAMARRALAKAKGE